ncbi:MAG: hypothetical protein ACE5IL_13685 [Myxococcota bacterium]
MKHASETPPSMAAVMLGRFGLLGLVLAMLGISLSLGWLAG